MTKGAWVTLATNDSYSLGALVLVHSLKRVESAYPAVILVTPSVTDTMRERLSSVFAEVITVDVLDSGDAAHLALLARPELGITFTKIHCWNLVQYEKCVFLDADTLVLQNCDELFEREELSASPDVGWPDCFNSGVFVFKPSKETFEALLRFAQERGSFDGGDQGLLNSFFSNWSQGDGSKRLPFLYNVTSAAFYSYLPALKQFGDEIKIIHFIGNMKPWLQKYDWSNRSVSAPGHLEAPLLYWWDLFTSQVHPYLEESMGSVRGFQVYYPQENQSYYTVVIDTQSEFPWHHCEITNIERDNNSESKLEKYINECNDPWENYSAHHNDVEEHTDSFNHTISKNNVVHDKKDEDFKHADKLYTDHYNKKDETCSKIAHTDNFVQNYNQHNISDDHFHDDVHKYEKSHENNYVHYLHTPNSTNTNHNPPNLCITTNQFVENHPKYFDHHSQNMTSNFDEQTQTNNTRNINEDIQAKQNQMLCNGNHSDISARESAHTEKVPPRHPYDAYYLRHRPQINNQGQKHCSHEQEQLRLRKKRSIETEQETSGLACTFSKLKTDPSAADEISRRQGWEAGSMDYMGQDSFANIWAKISETLAKKNQEPKRQTPEKSVAKSEEKQVDHTQPKEPVEEVKLEDESNSCSIAQESLPKSAESLPDTSLNIDSSTTLPTASSVSLSLESPENLPTISTTPLKSSEQSFVESTKPLADEPSVPIPVDSSVLIPDEPSHSEPSATNLAASLQSSSVVTDKSGNDSAHVTVQSSESVPVELALPEPVESATTVPDEAVKSCEPGRIDSILPEPIEATLSELTESSVLESDGASSSISDENSTSASKIFEPSQETAVSELVCETKATDSSNLADASPTIDAEVQKGENIIPLQKDSSKLENTSLGSNSSDKPLAAAESIKEEAVITDKNQEAGITTIPGTETAVNSSETTVVNVNVDNAKAKEENLPGSDTKTDSNAVGQDDSFKENLLKKTLTEAINEAIKEPMNPEKTKEETTKPDPASLSPPLVDSPASNITPMDTSATEAKLDERRLRPPSREAVESPDSELEDAALLAHLIVSAELAGSSASPRYLSSAPVTTPTEMIIGKPRKGKKLPTLAQPESPPVPPPRNRDKKIKKK